nr:hypothetical protein 8 [Campylobacterota bacterium]
MQKKRKNMQHIEIVSALERLVKIHDDFKKLEKSVSGASSLKSKTPFDIYVMQLLRHDRANGGSILHDLENNVAKLRSAQPDFRPMANATIAQLEKYSSLINNLSFRMEKQLQLAKLLEAKNTLKVSTDVFEEKKISIIKNILREIK